MAGQVNFILETESVIHWPCMDTLQEEIDFCMALFQLMHFLVREGVKKKCQSKETFITLMF